MEDTKPATDTKPAPAAAPAAAPSPQADSRKAEAAVLDEVAALRKRMDAIDGADEPAPAAPAKRAAGFFDFLDSPAF